MKMKKIFSLLLAGLSLTLSRSPLLSVGDVNAAEETERIYNKTILQSADTELNVLDYIDSSRIYSLTVMGCSETEVLNIPEQIKEVEIRDCLSLKEINVSEENSELCSIDGVLYNKEADTLIAYPSGKEDKEFVIPDGVKCIAENAFEYCTVESVIMPDSLVTIENRAFYESPGLRKVVMSPNIRGSCDNIFTGCNALKEITFTDKDYEPNTFSSFLREEDERYLGMLWRNYSEQIILYVPDENFYSYYDLAKLLDNQNTVLVPMSIKPEGIDEPFDINADGIISLADMVTLTNHLLGKKCETVVGSDLNRDGVTDAFDLVVMRKLFDYNYYLMLGDYR